MFCTKKKAGGGERATYNARWIVRHDDDILRPELVQIESIPGELGVGAVETLTAADELDQQHADTSVVLLNSLVSFYQQESLWVYHTRAALELALTALVFASLSMQTDDVL